MDAIEYHTWGESIPPDDLAITQTTALANAITKYPFANLIEVRRDGKRDGLVVDFEPELPQRPVVPILACERLLITVEPDADTRPRILALRRDFPSAPHLNLTPEGAPKELCVFEEEYREARLRLTPRLLLDRIADWLARAAIEELHLPGQPLEPLLLTSDRLIFDRDIFGTDPEDQPIVVVYRCSESASILRAYALPKDADLGKIRDDAPLHLVLPITCEPRHSRLIHHCPANFQDLVTLLKAVGCDLEDEARGIIRRVYEQDKLDVIKKHHLIPIVTLPKTRHKGGPVEATEWWAFIVDCSIDELAVKLDLRGDDQEDFHIPLGGHQSRDLETIPVAPIRPTYALSKRYARLLSGVPEDDPSLVVVGAGTLGSQVSLTLARQGFGRWTIIDEDHLLPHNLPRHALSIRDEGQNKAEALASEICQLLNEGGAARPFALDILRNADDDEDCAAAIRKADAILDFSASHAVARSLAHAEYAAPRMCGFLSPNARYLILLSEGQERLVRVDDLELQLKAAIAEDKNLSDVFSDDTRAVPYAGSCRDASVQLPQDVVAIQAGAAASFIKNHVFSIGPSISLWKWCDITYSLTHHRVPVQMVDVEQVVEWTVRLSSHAVQQMRYYRRRQLPNETGGVVLGQVDLGRKTIYVATVLPSPPDSVEWPNLYIRGTKGLRAKVARAAEVTRGDLNYVGEWHSHPDGCASDPSADDREAHNLLTREMGEAGWPGLVLIQGESYKPHIMVELAD